MGVIRLKNITIFHDIFCCEYENSIIYFTSADGPESRANTVRKRTIIKYCITAIKMAKQIWKLECYSQINHTGEHLTNTCRIDNLTLGKTIVNIVRILFFSIKMQTVFRFRWVQCVHNAAWYLRPNMVSICNYVLFGLDPVIRHNRIITVMNRWTESIKPFEL